jgi:hypothetical protein
MDAEVELFWLKLPPLNPQSTASGVPAAGLSAATLAWIGLEGSQLAGPAAESERTLAPHCGGLAAQLQYWVRSIVRSGPVGKSVRKKSKRLLPIAILQSLQSSHDK